MVFHISYFKKYPVTNTKVHILDGDVQQGINGKQDGILDNGFYYNNKNMKCSMPFSNKGFYLLLCKDRQCDVLKQTSTLSLVFSSNNSYTIK